MAKNFFKFVFLAVSNSSFFERRKNIFLFVFLFLLFLFSGVLSTKTVFAGSETVVTPLSCNSFRISPNFNPQVITGDAATAWFKIYRWQGYYVDLGFFQGTNNSYVDSGLADSPYPYGYTLQYYGSGPAPGYAETAEDWTYVTVNCSATITVNETPVTGGSWSINGTWTANVNTVTPSSGGTSYCLSSTGLPRGYQLLRIDNSVTGNNSSCFVGFPGGNYSFTINYYIPDPPEPPPGPPPPPTGLTATPGACGTGTINVSWDTSSGATSYTLRDGITVIYSGSNTFFSHMGLVAGSSHSYSVLASNSNGSSNYSGSVSANAPSTCPPPPPGPPPPPTGLTVTPGACGTNTLNISWNASSGATSYQLFRNGVQIYSGSNTSFSNTGLVAGQTYSYTVRATNINGSSAQTLPVSGTVSGSCNVPPDNPQNALAISGPCGSNYIDIYWDAVSGANGYVVHRGTTSGGPYTNISGNVSMSPFRDSTVSPGVIYYYRVVAYNDYGPSSYSNQAPGTGPSSCASAVDILGRPGNSPSWSQGPVYLPYLISGNVDSFALTWSSTNTTLCSIGAPVNSGVSTTGDLGPVSHTHPYHPSAVGTTYTITCNSSFGGTVTDSIFAQRAPSAPSISAVTSSSCGGGIVVNWTSSVGATSYKVYRDGGSTPIYTGPATTFTDTVDPNTSHYYRVRASNPAGDSPLSNSSGWVSSSGVCAPTVNIIGRQAGTGSFVDGPITIPTGGSVDVSWTSTDVTNCTASGWWGGNYGPSGAFNNLGPVNFNTFFGLSCIGPGGNASDSFVVNVSSPLPDLTAGLVTPTSATAGTALTFTGTITNSGTASTGSSFSNLFQVATAGGGGGTVSTLSVNSRSALSAGSSGPVTSSSYTFPSSGTYSVRLCADSNASFVGTITESDEGNNCGAWTNISVSAPSFDYTLTNDGNVSVTKTASNATGQSTVTKTLTSGATQSISLSTTGAPDGVSALPSNQTCNLTCQSTIIFTVPSATPIGTYPITVTGTPGNKTTNFNLIINNPSAISASCSVSPAPAQIGQPVTWSVNVIGGSGSFTYLWSGDEITAPNPTTASFQKTYQSTGIKNANVVVTDTVSGGTASCPGGVLGQTQVQISVRPSFQEF